MIYASAVSDVLIPILTNTPPALVFAAIIWYFLSRTLPALEAIHERQELTQRSDLLELVRKEKELAEKVIQIFASAEQLTLKDNNERIGELQAKADILRNAAIDILQALKSTTVVSDEIARVRTRLSELESKYGSDPARGARRSRKPDDPPPT